MLKTIAVAEKVLEFNMSIEVSHLVTVGCSFTYCQGLYDPPRQGWPRLLSHLMKVPVVNIATPGIGNDGIERRMVEYFYKNLDYNNKPFFIFCMSQNTRREEFFAEKHSHPGHPYNDYDIVASSDTDPLAKALWFNMNERGILMSEVKKLRIWASLINLMEANNIPFLTTDYLPDVTEETEKYIMNNHRNLKSFIDSHPNKLMNFNSITANMPKALDNGHDGPEAQEKLANYIFKQLVRRYGDVVPVEKEFLSLRNFPTDYEPRFKRRNQWWAYEMKKDYYLGLN